MNRAQVVAAAGVARAHQVAGLVAAVVGAQVPCTCSHAGYAHTLRKGANSGPCTHGDAAGPCPCTAYQPD